MTDSVQVAFGDSAADTATLLLEAAQKLGYEPDVVRTRSDHHTGFTYEVPADVAKSAGFKPVEDFDHEAQLKADNEAAKADEKARTDQSAKTTEDNPVDQQADQTEARKAAKKAPAKKTAAKKTTAKKTAAKKTAK